MVDSKDPKRLQSSLLEPCGLGDTMIRESVTSSVKGEGGRQKDRS